MNTTHLNNKHQHTLERIREHPTTHNLEWKDVISMVEHLGTVDQKGGGHLSFAINGVNAEFLRTDDKDVSQVHQVLELRRFLEHAGVGKTGLPKASPAPPIAKNRLLVVIDQKETLLFRSEEKGTVPDRVHPYDPHGVLHHLNVTLGRDTGSRAPENLAYYKQIATAMEGVDEVLVMGNGTGASSAMSHLTDFLAAHHPELEGKVLGALAMDLGSLTDGQLLHEARLFFIRHDG